MQGVMLFSVRECDLTVIKETLIARNIEGAEVYESTALNYPQLTVRDGVNLVKINHESHAREQFDESELRAIDAVLGTASSNALAVTYRWNGLEFVSQVLSVLLESTPMCFISDGGLITSSNEVLSGLRRNPDWDWRLAEVLP